jgi:hypothetical protein
MSRSETRLSISERGASLKTANGQVKPVVFRPYLTTCSFLDPKSPFSTTKAGITELPAVYAGASINEDIKCN